jgi:hypothetical protein
MMVRIVSVYQLVSLKIVVNRILKNFSADRNPHVTLMKKSILEDYVNYEKHKYSDETIINLSIWTHAYLWYSDKHHKIMRYLDKYWFKKILSFTNKI